MKTQELWDVPSSWTWSTLSGLGDVVGGGTPSTKVPEYWGGDVNWISPADLTAYGSKTIAHGAKSLTEAGLDSSSAIVMPPGSVHFSSRAPIGYVVVSAAPMATNQGFRSLVPHTGVMCEFVYYYLKSAKQLATKHASGTTFLEISGKAFGALPIPVAPYREQRRIIAKIEELFSELDKGVEALTTAREQLKAYRQSVLKHAFEGGLTEDWRASNQDIETGSKLRLHVLRLRKHQWEEAEKNRLEQEERLPRNDSWKARYPLPEAFEDEHLPELPTQWCWAGLDELVSGKPRSMQSGPFGSNLRHSEFRPSGVFVIGIDNVHDGTFSMGSEHRISEEKFLELEKYQARPGDLLVTVMASLGRTCIVPRDLEKAIITKHVYRISMDESVLYPEFLITYSNLTPQVVDACLRMFKVRLDLGSTVLS